MTDVPRTDVPRIDVPRIDVPRTDVPRTDVPRTDVPTRPLPRFPEPDTEPAWRATAEHRLLYQVDPQTGEPVPATRRRPDGSPQWLESAGEGVIYTYTVIRQHGQPYFRSRVPYVVALVDLDEGFRMVTEIVADPATVRIGQRVRVTWDDHGEISVPVFRPA